MRSSYKPRSLRTRERKVKRNIIVSFILGIVLLYLVIFWVLPALLGGISFINKFKGKPKPDTIEDSAIAPPVLNIPFESTSSARMRISGYASTDSEVEIYIDDSLKTTAKTEFDGRFNSDFVELSLGTNNIYGQTVVKKKEFAFKSNQAYF